MFSRHVLHPFLAVIALALSCETSEAAKRVAPPPRFPFKVDPATPLMELLPTPPDTQAKLPGVLNEDLALVPDLMFAKPLANDLESFKSQEATAHMMAKINYLNQKSEDGFLKAYLEKRDDLRGLPFLLGKDCRTEKAKAQAFTAVVQVVQDHLRCAGLGFKDPDFPTKVESERAAATFWKMFKSWSAGIDAEDLGTSVSPEEIDRCIVAALMQMITPQSEPFRTELVKHLTTIKHGDATRALAKLALYSPEDAIRSAAIDGLKARKASEYVDVLRAGFRYPLPAVSKRAAEAFVKLLAKDEIPHLVRVLEEPDPRAPAKKKVDGKEATFVRELVRVNHHHNCLLCHAPGNTADVAPTVLKAAVPQPSLSLPSPFQGYGSRQSPDTFVRIDMTYLRQDFSVTMKVDDAKPWPEMQRFDFFVRNREVSTKEAADYETLLAKQTPPNHVAAQYALRELTGSTPADTSPAAWRKLLQRP